MRFDELSSLDRVYGESRLREPSFVMRDYHYHGFYELYYVERGACRFFVDDRLYQMREGDFLLIPPEYLHYTSYMESCLRFSVYFSRRDIDREVERLADFSDRFAKPAFFSIPLAWRSGIRQVIGRIEQEERLLDEGSAASIRLLLNELMLMAVRFGDFPEAVPDDIYSTDEGILKAARYISSNYSKRLTQDRLAELSGYSPNYFSRKFKETTGIGAHEYLRLVRLKHGAELLRAGNKTVMSIAIEVGFSDANYFKDAFKKLYGLSPREYRRNSANSNVV